MPFRLTESKSESGRQGACTLHQDRLATKAHRQEQRNAIHLISGDIFRHFYINFPKTMKYTLELYNG